MSFWKRLFHREKYAGLSDDEAAVVDRLVARMTALEKQDSRRELEWIMWYDKFRTLFARIAKRAERIEQAEPDAPETAQDDPRLTNRPHVGYGHPPMPRRIQRGF